MKKKIETRLKEVNLKIKILDIVIYYESRSAFSFMESSNFLHMNDLQVERTVLEELLK